MSTAVMTERITQTSPSLKARIAGVFYFLCFVTGYRPNAASTPPKTPRTPSLAST